MDKLKTCPHGGEAVLRGTLDVAEGVDPWPQVFNLRNPHMGNGQVKNLPPRGKRTPASCKRALEENPYPVPQGA